MSRNRIILKNLSLQCIKNILENSNSKYILLDNCKIYTRYSNYKVLEKYNYTCAICGKKASYCNLEYNNKYHFHFNAYRKWRDDDQRSYLSTFKRGIKLH